MYTYTADGIMTIQGVSVESIAQTYGTPTYIYCADTLVANYKRYEQALAILPNASVFFAVKSNDNLAVLKLLANAGAGADVVSHGEYVRATTAGIPPHKIVYSGVGKTIHAITHALKTGVHQINVESIPELHLINDIAGELGVVANIAIRVNPDVDSQTHAKISTGGKEDKFGIDITLAPDVYQTAYDLPHINAVSVAVHIGSQLTQIAPYATAYKRVRDLVQTLNQQGIALQRVDLGGGVGIAYHGDETLIDLNEYAQMVADTFGDLGVDIMVEPGRSISANAGVLLSAVEYIKHGQAKTFVIMDSAMNDLMRPTLYDGYHHMIPVQQRDNTQTADIVGPVCETGDTFAKNVLTPDYKRGDLAVFLNAGAYGSVMANTYNTRPLVAEILIQNGTATEIRKRQTLDELMGRDMIPPAL